MPRGIQAANDAEGADFPDCRTGKCALEQFQMENRRTFLKASAITAALARSVPGANDRIQMGLIGCGTRGSMVSGFFGRHKDCMFIAACDVAKGRLEQAVTRLGEQGGGIKVDAY